MNVMERRPTTDCYILLILRQIRLHYCFSISTAIKASRTKIDKSGVCGELDNEKAVTAWVSVELRSAPYISLDMVSKAFVARNHTIASDSCEAVNI